MNKNNIDVQLKDATIFDNNFESKFDVVLCDAPCSGTGVIKDNPDIKLNRSSNSIDELTALQLKILNNVKKYVKTGGYLCYSTCSILRRENDLLIQAFLKENSNFKYVAVDSKLPNLKTNYGLQFLPNISSGAGFYFVKLQKV